MENWRSKSEFYTKVNYIPPHDAYFKTEDGRFAIQLLGVTTAPFGLGAEKEFPTKLQAGGNTLRQAIEESQKTNALNKAANELFMLLKSLETPRSLAFIKSADPLALDLSSIRALSDEEKKSFLEKWNSIWGSLMALIPQYCGKKEIADQSMFFSVLLGPGSTHIVSISDIVGKLKTEKGEKPAPESEVVQVRENIAWPALKNPGEIRALRQKSISLILPATAVLNQPFTIAVLEFEGNGSRPLKNTTVVLRDKTGNDILKIQTDERGAFSFAADSKGTYDYDVFSAAKKKIGHVSFTLE